MDHEPPPIAENNPKREILEPWERQTIDMFNAIELVHRKSITESHDGFDGEDVIEINRAVMNTEYILNPHLYGRLRKKEVRIVSTINGKTRESSVKPVSVKELQYIFENFSEELKMRTAEISPMSKVADVLNTASWAHIEMIRIHPFLDGNGRTARLLVDLMFARANLPYITDWGSSNREYIDCVYRTHLRENASIFKIFVARKLLKSVLALEQIGSGVSEYVSDIKEQTEIYLRNLKLGNES